MKEEYIPCSKVAPEGMVCVPGGSFCMGNENGSYVQKPVHKVILNPFFMSETVVTVSEFEKYIDEYFPDENWYNTDVEYCFLKSNKINTDYKDYPVNCVSWYAANDYCIKLGKRLPTEAEWEYTANNGKKHKSFETYCNNLRLCKVKSYNKNDFGLYDMIEYPREWCLDLYQYNYYTYCISSCINPINNLRNYGFRVIRGDYSSSDNLATIRNYASEDYLDKTISFRCVMDDY